MFLWTRTEPQSENLAIGSTTLETLIVEWTSILEGYLSELGEAIIENLTSKQVLKNCDGWQNR